jgi:hypothetical protein
MQIHGIDMKDLFPYREASKKVPGRRPGSNVSERTIERWCQEGLQKGQTRIKLRVVRLGNDLFTCESWLMAFIEELSSDLDVERGGGEQPRTPKQRKGVSSDARKQLDDLWKKNKAKAG